MARPAACTATVTATRAQAMRVMEITVRGGGCRVLSSVFDSGSLRKDGPCFSKAIHGIGHAGEPGDPAELFVHPLVAQAVSHRRPGLDRLHPDAGLGQFASKFCEHL